MIRRLALAVNYCRGGETGDSPAAYSGRRRRKFRRRSSDLLGGGGSGGGETRRDELIWWDCFCVSAAAAHDVVAQLPVAAQLFSSRTLGQRHKANVTRKPTNRSSGSIESIRRIQTLFCGLRRAVPSGTVGRRRSCSRRPKKGRHSLSPATRLPVAIVH